ncbi:2-isopropylmalate synthase [Marinobacter antarcticus]|uniref:2-isopropylmalate synthase n=2 Tax=root TaxID=1 RepID=A0A831W011_9GAMM|nr:2-isopropylmalate synthase [Marinobacter antarcticus]HEA53055.1 2-isopropylmalate synthase [Marinobacter antarcticus]
MIRTEAQRQFYLGLAGVRLWYAREPLPGAAPSPEFLFPEPDEQATPLVSGKVKTAVAPAEEAALNPAPAAPETGKRGAQRIANLQALMDQGVETTGKESQAQPPPVEARLPTDQPQNTTTPAPMAQVQTGKALSLSVGVFFGQRHILIASISKEVSLGLQETLAINILKSLGEAQAKPSAWVQWPVFNNRLVAGGTIADLVSVMKPVLSDVAKKKVIVLGRIGDGDSGEGNSGWLAETLARCPDIEFEYSLAELASNPRSKRSLWQQLKPLVRT